MQDGPLDMRMDRQGNLTAADIVNGYSEADLVRIIQDYGEERWAKRIAQFIVAARSEKPITTTGELPKLSNRPFPPGHAVKVRIRLNEHFRRFALK